MGIAEQAKGAIKEKVGGLTDQDDLQAEGKAQKEKGEAETTETVEKAKAQKAEKEADALDEQASNL
jgi:uncharacterized protein YjbJ (UPF0337 family)